MGRLTDFIRVSEEGLMDWYGKEKYSRPPDWLQQIVFEGKRDGDRLKVKGAVFVFGLILLTRGVKF